MKTLLGTTLDTGLARKRRRAESVVCHFRILLQIPGFETKLHLWTPGRSGGDHRPAWPPAVTALLRKLLGSRPPSSYSACASELQRRLAFRTDRASVRRWALAHGPAPATRHKPRRRPIKRWQVAHEGALWQDDTTPHAFLPHTRDKQVLFNLLDDATRYNVGARLYPGETLLAHLDFLSRTFQAHGLPLALYVDCHSFFYTHNPEALTQLGQTLHFYGVALRYAPTPQAKGKVKRRHDYWRQRLPALLAEHKEQISGPCPLRAAQLGSLLEVFAQFKDPRRGHGLKHRQPFVLACAALAMLLGAGGYEAFEEECAKLTQRQLRALGGRPDLQSGRCQAPSDTTFFRVLNGIDAAEFDLRMGQWMMAQEMAILQSLAVDGKCLRGSTRTGGKPLQLLSAVSHRLRLTVAQQPLDEKSNEIPALQPLLNQLPKGALEGSLITADAIQCQQESSRFVTQALGADYLWSLKGNQSGILERAQARLPQVFPPCVQSETL